MPTFTLELWRVLDMKPDATPEDTWIGLSDYPIFAEDYREELNTKIKNHFMYQEIGHETVEQFSFAMKRKMAEIMPMYNQLYESTKLNYDPLSTMDIRTVSKGTQQQVSEGASSNVTNSDIDAKSKNVLSNFPQTRLNGNSDYASSGADTTSETKTEANVAEESSATSNAQNDSDSHTSGYQGIPAQLIQAYRAAIINVDLLIFAELDELFMLVWGNSDEYSRTKGRLYL